MNIIDFEIKLAQVCSIIVSCCSPLVPLSQGESPVMHFRRIFHYVQAMPSGRKAYDDENLYRKLRVKELNEYAGSDQVCYVTLNAVIAP